MGMGIGIRIGGCMLAMNGWGGVFFSSFRCGLDCQCSLDGRWSLGLPVPAAGRGGVGWLVRSAGRLMVGYGYGCGWV